RPRQPDAKAGQLVTFGAVLQRLAEIRAEVGALRVSASGEEPGVPAKALQCAERRVGLREQRNSGVVERTPCAGLELAARGPDGHDGLADLVLYGHQVTRELQRVVDLRGEREEDQDVDVRVGAEDLQRLLHLLRVAAEAGGRIKRVLR